MKTESQRLVNRYLVRNIAGFCEPKLEEAFAWSCTDVRGHRQITNEAEEKPESKTMIQMSFTTVSIVGLIASIVLFIFAYNRQLFTSQAALQAFISGWGTAGIIIFILFQVIQVIIPILPGGLGCLAGVLLFGPWTGLLYNYIGISIGSVAAFFIARHFGKPVLYSLFSQKMIAKYESWTGSDSKFTKYFAIAIFLPVAPDDFLCYLAGTTQMKWTKFTGIILLGKPLAIALYSLGLYGGLQHFAALVQ